MATDRELGTSRSWFAVFNNPQDHGYDGKPIEVLERLKNEWIENNPTRTGAWAYCISAEGLKHVHMVLEDLKPMRFTTIKNTYAKGMHFEPTKGSKEQAEAYINKSGKYEEKGETVVQLIKHGEIKGNKGNRRDLEIIEELLEQGNTPQQIMGMSISYRRYEKMIKDAYFRKRYTETPRIRDIKVIWHVGASGSGKSYSHCTLAEQYGDDSLYFVTDYESGGFDLYNGEPILFMDEFKGQIRFSTLLNILDKYKVQIHSRYANCIALWNEVHITSVLPPEKVYSNMVTTLQDYDTYEQLKRRITTIIYHYKDRKGQFAQIELPMSEYINYEVLKSKVSSQTDEFIKLDANTKSPFDEDEQITFEFK